MDRGLLYLAALITGLLAGLFISRRWRPLLLERWRVLPLAPLAALTAALPWILSVRRPEWLWAGDRRALICLVALRCLFWIFLILVNLLPAAVFRNPAKGLPGWQKLALLLVLAGLTGEAAVLLLNHAYWPVAESFLTESQNQAMIAGIRNQAYLMLQVIGPQTRLPWLGQIWAWKWRISGGAPALPTISPAEVLIAAGLFLTGVSQFLPVKQRDKDKSNP